MKHKKSQINLNEYIYFCVSHSNMAFINYHGKQSGSMKLFYDIAFIMYRRNGEVGVYFNEG